MKVFDEEKRIMHPISLRYLSDLKERYERRFGKLTITEPVGGDNSAVEKTHSTLSNYILSTFGEDRREELSLHQWDMDYWMLQLEQRLYEDLEDYCTERELLVLRQLAIAYFPLNNANAFAGRVPDQSSNHVIVVHLMLIWISSLLTQALLLASQNQYEMGREVYQVTMRGYLKKSFLSAFKEWSSSSIGDDDRLLAESGAIGTVILRFVGLHELGHLMLGHVDKINMSYVPELGLVEYRNSEELTQAEIWEMEYSADQFAVDHLLARTGGLEQMWNNMLFISAFFRFIEHADLLQGVQQRDTHPSPALRIQALLQRVTEILGPPPNDAQRWAETVLLDWRDA